MDKVKQAGEFVWKHRFWFSLGFAVLLAFLTIQQGTNVLEVQANQRRSALDNTYKSVQSFTMGDSHPNQTAIAEVGAVVTKLDEQVSKTWEEIYQEQQPLMTWPSVVAELFMKRPFGADLSDQSNRFLVQYQRAYPDQVVDLYYELDPISIEGDAGDEVYGTIDADQAVLHRAEWTRIPLSSEAWQAQEELWIQRAIVKAIRKANEGATDWHSAAIRRLLAIGIGEEGLDAETEAQQPQLVDTTGMPSGSGGAGQPPGTAQVGGGDQGIKPNRYLEKTEQYRVVPIYLSMIVDQGKIPTVLASLSEADFNFTIQQVNLGVPTEPVATPAVIQQASLFGQGGARDDSIFNSMQLDVWGQMRIYEMPPSMQPKPEGAPIEGMPEDG